MCLQAALHPTPAVCGRPRAAAKDILASKEPFDRGFYSGPFGWLSGSAAEFVVAIRSALIHPQGSAAGNKQPASMMESPGLSAAPPQNQQNASHPSSHGTQSSNSKAKADLGIISLFAGVGIVKGSTAEAEWQVWLPCIPCFHSMRLCCCIPFSCLP